MALAKYYEDNRIMNEERMDPEQGLFSSQPSRWRPSPELRDTEFSVGIYYPAYMQTLFKRVHTPPKRCRKRGKQLQYSY